jgi:hypothetical protein
MADRGRWPGVEVGGQVRSEVERPSHHLVMHPDGVLSRSTASHVGRALVELLADGRPVLVELAGLRLGWAPAVEVYPMALNTLGGWPTARLVLFAADHDLAAALHDARVPERVPLVPDRRAARAHVDERPSVVHRHFNLVNRPVSSRFVREAADTACHDWRIPQLAPVLALLADELVTHAVEHTDGAVGLTFSLRGSDLTVSVRDGLACSAPRPQLSCVGRPCGRGLQVVAALATRWGVTQHHDGKTVWAALSTAGPTTRSSLDEKVPDGPVR